LGSGWSGVSVPVTFDQEARAELFLGVVQRTNALAPQQSREIKARNAISTRLSKRKRGTPLKQRKNLKKIGRK